MKKWFPLLLSLSACSYAFMSPPITPMSADCNDRVEAPVVDTVIAGANAGILLAASGSGLLGNHDWELLTERLLLFTVPWVVLNGTSAVYGFISRDSCRAEHPRR